MGLWLKDYGLYLALFLLFSLTGAILFFFTRAGQRTSQDLLYRSRFYRRILLVRFCAALSALLESGRTLSESLRDAREVLGNRNAQKALSFVAAHPLPGRHGKR